MQNFYVQISVWEHLSSHYFPNYKDFFHIAFLFPVTNKSSAIYLRCFILGNRASKPDCASAGLLNYFTLNYSKS